MEVTPRPRCGSISLLDSSDEYSTEFLSILLVSLRSLQSSLAASSQCPCGTFSDAFCAPSAARVSRSVGAAASVSASQERQSNEPWAPAKFLILILAE